jgi:NAD(P)H-flavin reductase
MNDKLTLATLAGIEPAARGALLARIEARSLDLFTAYRLPGMTVRLKAGDAGPVEVALASQPERRAFEALVARDSPLGEALAKRGPRSDVEISAPSGAGFPCFDFRRHDLYLIGNGLGLGPVRAAVLHALTERGAFDAIAVLAEARFLDEIPFHDELPAWQRAGVKVFQVLARPDMGKWKRGEGAYVADLLRERRLDPARSVVFASGTADMLRGVQAVCRAARLPPEKLFTFELIASGRERAREVERPAALLGKITPEGIYGSGHQKDAPDHAPGLRTPQEQPRGTGLAPYQRALAGEASAGH